LLILYRLFGDNFGFAVLGFTLILRTALIPFTIPTLKSQKKIQSLKPQLDAIKKKYGADKARLQQEQMKLYKQNNVNPLGGCLPSVLQFIVLIALYQVLNKFLHNQVPNIQISTMFFGIDLAKPDTTHILPILSGVMQLVLSLMILPGAESHEVPVGKTKSVVVKKEAKKEEDTLEMAESMQRQMVFVLPVVTTFAALQFPAGLAMYWVATTLYSIVQQWIVSGPGGLITTVKKLLPKKEKHD